ncbi:MAG TPA: phosphodiesterase [Solirubrobacterales bacterium]|nr:phosphodiesterase [Solirubrobacterales bacterium]
MSTPTLLAQLSDLHIGGSENGVDPVPRLEAVVEGVRSLPNQPDAVLVSGDLTHDGGDREFRLAREILGRLDVPLHVMPGNHDDRALVRETFGLPGAGAEPVRYSVDIDELRLVVFDSNVPGQDPGRYGSEQLRWLDSELKKDPERPTLLAMHHPPLVTGVREWDGINLEPGQLEALAEVVAKHPQLRAIVGGHLHRIAASALAGCPVLAVPSTYLQAQPDFHSEGVEFGGTPGFALHALLDGELSSQVESVVL